MLDVAVHGGITDFTDGRYEGESSRGYDEAQARQAEWLLDKINCKRGSFVLDIGCGYGRILESAEERGAKAKGITLSGYQQKRCQKNDLDVDVMDYKEIPEDWRGLFDGAIANGSLEHFVQVKDALEGRQDELYREMFKIVHETLEEGGKFATTAIHFNQEVDPREISCGSKMFDKNSDNAHFSRILFENLGGWYPAGNQLERCAEGLFNLEEREDGSEDYNLTSEYWLRAIKKSLKRNPIVWGSIAGKFVRNPKAAWGMLDTWFFSQSWMWQFRQKEDGSRPTVLYRDVWKRVD